MDGQVRVTIHFYNLVRDVVGRKSEEITFPGQPTVGTLLGALETRHGRRFSALVRAPGGEPNAHIRLFLNDEVLIGDFRERPLKDGDAVALFSAVSGG